VRAFESRPERDQSSEIAKMPNQTRKRKVTREEIARRAGVSATVVTWVINGQAAEKRIAASTIRRVETVAKKLNYEPNVWGRALRAQSSGILGFVSTNLTDPNASEIIKYLERAARPRGLGLMLFDLHEYRPMEIASTAIRHLQFCDGFILNVLEDAFLKELKTGILAHRPFCVIGKNMREEDVPSVEVNNASGSETAIRHLVEAGTTRLGIIADERAQRFTQERLEGCKRAIAALSLAQVQTYWRQHGEEDFTAGVNAVRVWAATGKIPDGIFAMGDLIAMGALSALNECGVACPAKTAVVGFDDTPFARYMSPPLTTVAQPYERMAEASLDMITTLMANNRLARRHILIEPELRVRKSTARSTGTSTAEA
jgi:LacI family transcriptional regulator